MSEERPAHLSIINGPARGIDVARLIHTDGDHRIARMHPKQLVTPVMEFLAGTDNQKMQQSRLPR